MQTFELEEASSVARAWACQNLIEFHVCVSDQSFSEPLTMGLNMNDDQALKHKYNVNSFM